MRSIFFCASSALTLSVASVSAGGWSAGTLGQNFMHADEGFAEISMGNVDYKVSADTANNYAGGQTTGIDVIKDSQRTSISAKIDFGEKISIGVTNFLSGSIQMQGGAGSFTSWIPDADADLTTTAILGSYQISDGISVLLGARVDALASTTVSTIKGNYAIAGSSKTRGVLGFSYQIPEIALKVSATYSPKDTISSGSSFTETTLMAANPVTYGDAIIANGLGIGANPNLLSSVASYTSTVGLPETLNLEFQTGIAENTLLFGNIIDAKWSKAQIDSNGSAASRITTSFADTTSYTVGVGRKVNDNWSLSLSYSQEDGAGAYGSSLFTVSNGSKSVSLGARYMKENMILSAGISMVEVGGVTITSDGTSAGTQYAKYGKNSATAMGVKIGFSF